ncbi:MAG: nucleoside triphosphate pyrophosphohydrolase [Patescibacteria group bacterium]
MISYEKLVRDRVPEILTAKGVSYEQREATEEEYKQELVRKLEEELAEFKENLSSEELGDLIEVIEALKKLPEFVDVEEIRKNKREEKGAFDARYILKGEK